MTEPCPSRADLERLLADQLDPVADAAVERHVEKCPACQQMLESLTAAEPASASFVLKRPLGDPTVPAFSPVRLPDQDVGLIRTLAGKVRALWNAGRPASGYPAGSAELPNLAGYQVLAEVGRGGMGVVYQARQISLNRLVALKVILAEAHASPEYRARFRLEAEATAALQHPNIVQVYEVGEHDGVPYFSMEFVEGGTLKQYLHGDPQPGRQAAALLETLARAVHHAHQRGVLHRDLKPANVLLSFSGDPQGSAGSALPCGSPLNECVAKITDFGLAKLWGSAASPGADQTRTGTVLGTPGYMAPEQARSKRQEMGPAVDVYALGAILYELLTGRPPFRADTPMETLLQMVSLEPVSVAALRPGVPRDLATIAHKCLQKEPRKRYASALELAEDLRRFRAGEPIHARPVGRLERGWRWCRRNPALASLWSLVVLLLLGGILVTSILAVEAKREADESHRLAGLEAQARQKAQEAEKSAREREAGEREQRERAEQALTFHTLQLAQAEWRQGRAGRAQQLLEGIAPERRRWEWGFLRRQSEGGLFTLYGHTGTVWSVAFSPDGTRLASADRGQTIKVWDAVTGDLVRDIPADGALVNAVTFSPDGKRLAAACTDRMVRVWEARTGALLLKRDLAREPLSVAFSPDGSLLAAGSDEGILKIWESRFGIPLHTLPGPIGARSVAFSPDGKRLASAGADKTVRLWDVLKGNPLFTLPGHTQEVLSVAFSPDGRLLASGSNDQTVRLHDAATGKTLLTLRGHTSDVYAVQFSPDGQTLISGSWDGTLRVWDPDTGVELRRLRGHSAVQSLALSPDGQRLVSGGADATVKVWDVRSEAQVLTLRGHSGSILALAFDPNLASAREGQRRLASAGSDGKVLVHDARTGVSLLALRPSKSEPGAEVGLKSLAFSPDGRQLAAGDFKGKVRVWDARTGASLLNLQVGWENVHGLAFSPDGRMLAAASNAGMVQIWDSGTGALLYTLQDHTGPVWCVAFNPDGKTLVSGGEDQTLKVRDAATGSPLLTLPSHSGAVHAVAYSPDGTRLASTHDHQLVKVWDARTGADLLTLRGPVKDSFCVAFSPDGQRLASGSVDGVVRVWDARTGTDLLTFQAHPLAVWGVAFSPDGSQLASAGADGTVRLWDARPRPGLLSFQGHAGMIRALMFSPDGRLLASAAGGPEVKLWDGRTGAWLRTLEGHKAGVVSLAFSADGRRLVSRDWGGQTLVRDVADGRLLAQAREPDPPDRGPWALSPDGLRLALGSFEGRIRLVDLSCADPGELAFRFAVGRADPDWHLEEAGRQENAGHWQAAVFHHLRAAGQRPEDASVWRRLALCQLGAGQEASYRQTCREVLRRFGPDGQAIAAARVLAAIYPFPLPLPAADPTPVERGALLRVCLLRPGVVADPTRLLASIPEGDTLTRGVVLYRANKSAEAVQLLRGPDVRATLWRALAEHARGRTAEAKEGLAQAVALLNVPRDQAVLGFGQRSWDEQLEGELLRKELETLLSTPPGRRVP